jgi:DNA invertase Pin-like site-specific DNA recombinase
MAGRIVAYYRVSTQRQGRSGLGLEAQRKAVTDYLNGGSWQFAGEFVEVESGKRDDNRPQLAAALAACRLHGAKLVIAKLDRLSRDAHFLIGLQKANVDFVAADMPDANKMTVGIMALVAQNEREAISRRTREALAAAKARGTKLGNSANLSNRQLGSERGNERNTAKAIARAQDLAPTIRQLQAQGVQAPKDIAAALNAKGIPTARGKMQWQAVQVSRVLSRMEGKGRRDGGT